MLTNDPAAPGPTPPASTRTLAVVIPAYNESQRILRTLSEVRPWLDAHFPDRYEVLVVDDGSRDRTAAVVEAEAARWPALRLLRQPRNLGKGAAVRRGCLAAHSDYVLFMDADHATPIDELHTFLPKMEEGYGVVVGVRTVQEDENYKRRIISLAALLLAHVIVFSKSVLDSQCGFKLFRRETCQDLFSRCRVNGGMLDVEIFYLAQARGARIWNQPVNWVNKPGSTISIWRCMLFDPFALLAIRLRGVCGVYAKALAKQPWER